MPRIIAGLWKGLRLSSPKGLDTRPTADQVKEAAFSMLESAPFEFEGSEVLDFFAGSGALGLEAASRGAARVVFADHSDPALETLARNLAALKGAEAELSVVKTRWPKGFERLPADRPFNLFILDPPYLEKRLPLFLLREAAERGLAAPGALALWEQAPETLAELDEGSLVPWRMVKNRRWGARAAAILSWERNWD